MATRSSVANRVQIRPMTNSLGFDGTSTVITKNSGTGYALGAFSVSFYINGLNNTANTSELYSEGSSVSNNQIYVLRGGPNTPRGKQLYMIVRNDANTTLLNNSPFSKNVLDGSWHHAVLTDNAGTCNLYVDGNLDPTTLTYTPGTLTLNRTAFGALVRGAAVNFLTGGSLMKECRVFNKVLSQAEITALYYRGIVPSGLILEYLLNEGSGTTATDTSGSGTNGTITGPVWSAITPIKARSVAGARTLVT